MLSDGYHDVPPGKIATVVTHLEMRAPPGKTEAREGIAGVAVRHVQAPDLGWYRDLYRRVGADWLWFSRLRMSDAALAVIIRDPAVSVYALGNGGTDEGLLELDFRSPGACELAFFGLTAGLIGRGAGRHLMQHAVAEAWRRPIGRFWVHTCTLDHPGALKFYQRSGFTVVRQQIEVADDPRLSGVLPESAAPHVPRIWSR
jgi:GNAT superfamily N-acetyltransferase